MKNVFNKVLDENHVDSILISDVLFKYYVGKTIMHDTMSESECELKIKIFKRRKMETNYQNLQYTDDEKAAAYVKAIIKAVEITREGALQAFYMLREQARENFPQGMSLEEINEEIRKTRYGVEDGE